VSEKRVEVGDVAPDFELASQTGQSVRLKDIIGKKPIVLYFYPKDFTSGCTTEACSFRDNFEVFKDMGAEIIGVSSDSVESHLDFAKKYNLPFTLLADVSGKVRELYGVPKAAGGLFPGRVTYIIDRVGVVRYIFESLTHAEHHVQEAIRVLRLL
jgi:peroxiredoxin Q/BCP